MRNKIKSIYINKFNGVIKINNSKHSIAQTVIAIEIAIKKYCNNAEKSILLWFINKWLNSIIERIRLAEKNKIEVGKITQIEIINPIKANAFTK